MTRDRFPQSPDFDFIRAGERVPHIPQPRPTTTVQPAGMAIGIGIGVFVLFLYALPDLAAWLSTWRSCP